LAEISDAATFSFFNLLGILLFGNVLVEAVMPTAAMVLEAFFRRH